jgi:anhydro-N-acetylmuramic acid kinase
LPSSIKFLNPKSEKTAIGLLSGTSVDGIDAILLKIKNCGTETKVKILDFKTFPIPKTLKASILLNSNNSSAKIVNICELNVYLAKMFANAALNICKKNKIKTEKVDFIGSHGQTIHHLPDKSKSRWKVKSTLQIGDPSVISNLTGITTVGDFRIADCTFDGDGAPLVPFLDYILFRSKTNNRGLLNIGGIANITILPKGCSKDEVFAFDTGPGNMLIDSLVKILFNKNFDKNAKIALSGKLNFELFSILQQDYYFKSKPPKSTGRELYGEKFVKEILRFVKRIPKEDIIYTLTEFTAFTIYYNIKKFVPAKIKLNELIVSGGGSCNPLIMKLLQEYLPDVKVKKFNFNGITAESKEAVLFAILANECLCGNPTNMKNVTGSKKDTILGKICLAYN